MGLKRFLLFLIILFTSIFLSADTKLPKLKSKEVVIVGKINVHVPEEELKFYAKSWGVTDFSAPDKYEIYNYNYKDVVLGRVTVLFQSSDWIHYTNDELYVCSEDDYFLSKREIKDKTKLKAESPVKWHFYGSEDFTIYIPFTFEADIPQGKKYIYVGDFDYYLDGSDFHVIKVTVKDNYDSAKEAIETLFGQTIDLYKAQLKPLKDDE